MVINLSYGEHYPMFEWPGPGDVHFKTVEKNICKSIMIPLASGTWHISLVVAGTLRENK